MDSCAFWSKYFYNGVVRSGYGRDHKIPDKKLKFFRKKPVLFVNIDEHEKKANDGSGVYNPGQIKEVLKYLSIFKNSGISSKNIAVISPYQKQILEINNAIRYRYEREE